MGYFLFTFLFLFLFFWNHSFGLPFSQKRRIRKYWTFRPCLDAYFLSLNFRHSSLITYHSSLIVLKYHTRLAPSLTCHHSIFFNCLWDPHTDPMSVDFYLSFFFPFVFSYFSLLFSSSMLTHILIKPTMILISYFS